MKMISFLAISGLVLFMGSEVMGQKGPELGYAFPPVLKIGEENKVRLGGFDFTDDMQFFFESENVETIEIGKPGEFVVTPPPYWFGPMASSPGIPVPREIAANLRVRDSAHQGVVAWQVANANGVSGKAWLLLSNTNEIVESRSRDLPQTIHELPTGVSGRVGKIAERDDYLLTVSESSFVRLHWDVAKIGSNLKPRIEVFEQLTEQASDAVESALDTKGLDGALTFFATANRTYRISVSDVSYRGDPSFVYRLLLEKSPHAETAYPMVLQRGVTQQVRLLGRGLASGEANTESLEVAVTVPADHREPTWKLPLPQSQESKFIELPLSDTKQIVGRSSGPSILDSPVQEELGITFDFQTDVASRELAVELKKDQLWELKLFPAEPARGTELRIKLLDSSNQVVWEGDADIQSRFERVFSVGSDGIFRLVLTRLAKGERELPFHLQLSKKMPEVRIEFPTHLISGLGSEIELPLKLTRYSPDEELDLQIEGLPSSVSLVSPLVVPAAAKDFKLKLKIEADQAVWTHKLAIRGKAKSGVPVRFRVAGSSGPDLDRGDLLLGLTMKPPFEVKLIDRNRQRAVPRGATYPAEYEVVYSDGYRGPVGLTMAARQSRHVQGVTTPTMMYPIAAERITYPVYLPEWLETNLTRRVTALSVGEVTDPKGNRRTLLKPTDGNVTFIMEGALLKIEPIEEEFEVGSGETIRIPVRISRTKSCAVPIRVRIELPAELRDLVEADSIELSPGTETGELTATIKSTEGMLGTWEWKVIAEGELEGSGRVASETDFEVDFR